MGNTRVVIYGGLAELIAGAISMGLGGYLGAKSEVYVYSFPTLFILKEVELRCAAGEEIKGGWLGRMEMRKGGVMLRT